MTTLSWRYINNNKETIKIYKTVFFQDEFGQFTFGHAGGPSARTEVYTFRYIRRHPDI